jgi:hypothetical protein
MLILGGPMATKPKKARERKRYLKIPLTEDMQSAIDEGAKQRSRERKQQINIALAEGTRTILEDLASKSGRSIAQEIRKRLDESIWEERTFDPETLSLGEEIGSLARTLELVSGGVRWHEHPLVHAAFVAAIAAWMNYCRPPPDPEKTLPPDFGPQAIGVAVARLQLKEGHEGRHWVKIPHEKWRRLWSSVAEEKGGKS